jgi:thioredoxin 1
MAKETFNDIIHSDTPVLIDFYADWCGPCQAMQPELQKLSATLDEKARVLKVNVDSNPQAAQALNVRGVPTLMIYKQGKLEWRASGYHTADQLLSVLQPLL